MAPDTRRGSRESAHQKGCSRKGTCGKGRCRRSRILTIGRRNVQAGEQVAAADSALAEPRVDQHQFVRLLGQLDGPEAGARPQSEPRADQGAAALRGGVRPSAHLRPAVGGAGPAAQLQRQRAQRGGRRRRRRPAAPQCRVRVGAVLPAAPRDGQREQRAPPERVALVLHLGGHRRAAQQPAQSALARRPTLHPRRPGAQRQQTSPKVRFSHAFRLE